MKTPKPLGVAFALAQNLKRIAVWSSPYEMRSEVGSTVCYAISVFYFFVLFFGEFLKFTSTMRLAMSIERCAATSIVI
jgi:hypothetical protein